MRKTRKRVFAAVLAAALLFTMPGMASYAEAKDAQTKDISESVTVQAEDDAAEETEAETEVMQESEAEDSDTDKSETGEKDTEGTETDAQEPAEDETVPPAQKEDAEECTCGTLCTQDSINGDCPVCGAEDADLSRCEGKKTENSSEENKEDAGQEDAGEQDDSSNLCAHHKEHTKDCGYSRASEDVEGSPCTYECRICPIEDLIAALPRTVTEDNADEVRAQLDQILDLYRELTEEEQEQVDISHCLDLQAALDGENAPMRVVSIPQKAKNSEGTMLEVGSDFIYEINGTTYNCIVVSSTSNEAAVVWKEMQNPESDLLESKQSMILSCEEKGGRLIKYAEYQVLSDYQIISLNDNYNTFGCQEYAACYYYNGYWTVDKTYTWTDWSYFIAFDLRCNFIEATENFNSEKYYDGTPFEEDTNSFTWKGTVAPTIKFYSDMNGTEISAPSAVGTYYIKLSIADPVVEDGIRYEAAESDYIEITILPIITEQPEGAELYYGYAAGSILSVTTAVDGAAYQWYENNSAIDGATQATYTVSTGKTVGTYQYYCKVSLGDYTEQSQTALVIILPCIHNNGVALTHYEKVEADCTNTGTLEYWDCSICGKKFSDKDGQTEITETEIPIASHQFTHHEKAEADCTQTGVLEYWGCSVCGKKFSDKDGQTEITETEIPIAAHTLTHYDGKEADCTQAGNREYWGCSVCGKKFSDKDGHTEITDADIAIPVKPHTLTHHAREEADCLTEGNIEYWSCNVCGKLFTNAGGTEEAADIKFQPQGIITASGKAITTERIPIAARHPAVVSLKQRIVLAALPLIRRKPNVEYAEANMESL